MIKLPSSVNIVGVRYKIIYVDNPAEVDTYKQRALWGQVDFWTRTIRIYQNDTPVEAVWEAIFHETLHAIADDLDIKCLKDDDNHDQLQVLARGLLDTFVRNGWMEIESPGD